MKNIPNAEDFLSSFLFVGGSKLQHLFKGTLTWTIEAYLPSPAVAIARSTELVGKAEQERKAKNSLSSSTYAHTLRYGWSHGFISGPI